jgi:NAD(P)-dependent dehydrogenase (short-subunit alcohol dehydrogenase family)
MVARGGSVRPISSSFPDDVPPVVLVTGAAGGMGAACAARFTAGGWQVAGADRREPAGDDLAFGIAADVRSVTACDASVAATVERFGRLDALVNCAGVWTEGAAENTTEAEWDRVVDTNLKGTYFMCRAAIPSLRSRGGCIVNFSSDAGVQGNKGAAVYCASKGGVSNLTRALALELAAEGVRVNAVCPADVDTPMLAGQASVYGGGDESGYLARLLGGYPQGRRARFIQPAEVAELVWYLCQPLAAPITGANVSIDFGLSAGIQ